MFWRRQKKFYNFFQDVNEKIYDERKTQDAVALWEQLGQGLSFQLAAKWNLYF